MSSPIILQDTDGDDITLQPSQTTDITVDVTTAGKNGVGIPAGGTTNQALTKINATDYNSQWSTIDKTFVGLGNVDNTSDANKPLSTATTSALAGKQATLVSGTNIKTINGTTLLGSGDIVIAGGGGSSVWGAITGTLSSQTDLQSALDAKLSLAGGTMTGQLNFGTQSYKLNGMTITAPTAGVGTINFPSVASTTTVVTTTSGQALSSKDLTAGTNTFPTFNQNTTGTASTITGSITESQVTNLVSDLAVKLSNITGLVTSGSNVTITGSGTNASPYVVNSTAAGGGGGTVTSITGSGGTTGLTLTGGPITTSGTLTLGGTLAVANGGTGSATQNFVDLTTTQTVAGAKTFSGVTSVFNAFQASAATGTFNLLSNGLMNYVRTAATTGSSTIFSLTSTFSQASTNGATSFSILPTYTQTGTSNSTDFQINRIETTVGSGTQRFVDLMVGSASKLTIDNTGSLGILATSGVSPFSLTLGSSSTGIALYNVSDQTTNWERALMSWTGNQFNILSNAAGTGTLRPLLVGAGSTTTKYDNSGGAVKITTNFTTTSVAPIVGYDLTGGLAASAGIQTAFRVSPILTQSGTAGYTALTVNATETSIGSGVKNLIDVQVNGTSKFRVDNTGTPVIPLNAGLNKVLTSDASGNATWQTLAAGTGDMILASAQTVTGAKTYNNNTLVLAGSTSGTTTLQANATAGTGTVILPTTGTVATLAGAETLTSKVINGALLNGANLVTPVMSSPAMSGTPTAPTATVGTNTTQLATTAFVLANVGSGGGDMVLASAQTVTGAKTFATKTLLDQGEIVFDVRAYGAVGNGGGTDSAAINSAIAAMPTYGGVLYFPAGDFIINSTITIPSNTTVRGAGKRATRLFKNGGTYPIFTIAGAAGTNKEKITIENISFEGNGQTGFAISAHYAQLVNINNVEANGFNDGVIDYMSVQDSYFHQFTANTNHNTTVPVINIYGSSGWSSNMIWFSQCRIEDFWAPAISISQGSGYTGVNNGFFITDCKFETTQAGGDILVFDSSVQELHVDHVFLSAGGFRSGYSTPVNGINFSGNLINSFEEIFMNGSTGTVASVIKTVSPSGSIVIDNINVNVTPSVATVNFNGTSGATYSIGQLSGSTPYLGGTIPDNYIPTNTTINGKASVSTLRIGTTSTTGYVFTATDTAGNGAWQAAAGGSGSGIIRSVSTVTTTITGGATALTDYVYLLSTGAAYTQPAASGNTDRYTISNITATNMVVSRTGSDTFFTSLSGQTNFTIKPGDSVDLISNGTSIWKVI